MRMFKKDGYIKYKKSDNEEYIESLLADGWAEVIKEGSAPKDEAKKEAPKEKSNKK